MKATWQHTVPVPELYAVIKFNFIKEFSLSRSQTHERHPNKPTDSCLQKNTLINYNLNLGILIHNILQGLFFIHSQSTAYNFNKNSKGGYSLTVWSLHIWVALQPLPAHSSELPNLSLAPSQPQPQPLVLAAAQPLSQDPVPESSPSWKAVAVLNRVAKRPSPTNTESYQ